MYCAYISAPKCGEKWSKLGCDRNFIKCGRMLLPASVRESSNQSRYGGSLPRERWVRREPSWSGDRTSGGPLVHDATQSSLDLGPKRRDPLGTRGARLARSSYAITTSDPQSASAMGSAAADEQAFVRASSGRPVRPDGASRPFGVGIIPMSGAYKPSVLCAPGPSLRGERKPTARLEHARTHHATVGDGCPGVVPSNRLNVSAKEVMDDSAI